MVHVGLVLSPSEDFRVAALPLFEEGLVEAVEWYVDMGFEGGPPIAPWIEALLRAYGDADRLYGHGVEHSMLSQRTTQRHTRWLDALARDLEAHRYQHLSEHFGFITAGSFENATVFPHPYSKEALNAGRARIASLREVFDGPVGLENLALAFSSVDVEAQPDFIDALLAPSDGFLLLDVHNLYCQALNFGVDPYALVDRYPLRRVREVHVAGGSITVPESDPLRRPFRRDTHSEDIPEALFDLVAYVVQRSPSLEVVVIERSDHTVLSPTDIRRFREDFLRLRTVVRDASARRIAPPTASRHPEPIVDDPATLDGFQRALLDALRDEVTPGDVRATLLARDDLAVYASWHGALEPRAVDVGMQLAHQWGHRTSVRPVGSMRRAVFDGARKPLRHEVVAIPTPGPGQVRVRVAVSALCGTDVHIFRGDFAVPEGTVCGHEPVGVVDCVGDDVSDVAVGDRVGVPWVQAGCGACAACARERWEHCVDPVTWIELGGGHSEWMIVDAQGVVRIPDGLEDALAAPLLCAGYTVLSALRRAQPRAEDVVAVHGVGGLGHLAVQVAKAYGHTVLAITSAETRRHELLRMGADDVIVHEGPDAGDQLAERGGADVVIATSNDLNATGALLAGLREEGRLIQCAIGPGRVSIAPDALVARGLSVLGAKQGPREDLEALLALAAAGRVLPWVEVYPFAELMRGLHRLAERRVRYCVSLVHAR